MTDRLRELVGVDIYGKTFLNPLISHIYQDSNGHAEFMRDDIHQRIGINTIQCRAILQQLHHQFNMQWWYAQYAYITKIHVDSRAMQRPILVVNLVKYTLSIIA